MKNVYKAHILFTKEKDHFEVLENGYILVEDGIVKGVSSNLRELDYEGAKVTDFGNKLLIPAMNDMHVHAPQVHNQGVAMDLELLPWLQNYTFPEESKYADVAYAERMYRRFIHTQWLFGTMRSVVFATVHTDSTRKLMHLYQEAGMGAMVGKVAMNRNCPDALCEDVDAYVEGQESLIAEATWLSPSGRRAEPSSLFTLHSSLPPLVRPIITPRFVPSCTPELLKACGELADKYQLPVQSHLSENVSEIAWVAELEPESENYGKIFVEGNPGASSCNVAAATAKGYVVDVVPSAVTQVSSHAQLRIAYNPATGTVDIAGLEAGQPVDIYNMWGGNVLHAQATASAATQHIDVTGLAPGVYIVTAAGRSLKLALK